MSFAGFDGQVRRMKGQSVTANVAKVFTDIAAKEQLAILSLHWTVTVIEAAKTITLQDEDGTALDIPPIVTDTIGSDEFNFATPIILDQGKDIKLVVTGGTTYVAICAVSRTSV